MMYMFLCFRPDRHSFDMGTHGSNCIRGTHGMAKDSLSDLNLLTNIDRQICWGPVLKVVQNFACCDSQANACAM